MWRLRNGTLQQAPHTLCTAGSSENKSYLVLPPSWKVLSKFISVYYNGHHLDILYIFPSVCVCMCVCMCVCVSEANISTILLASFILNKFRSATNLCPLHLPLWGVCWSWCFLPSIHPLFFRLQFSPPAIDILLRYHVSNSVTSHSLQICKLS